MGLLVDGTRHDRWRDTQPHGGRFVCAESQFRSWVTEDGSAGPTGKGSFDACPDRYHLYVSYACPWAHRKLIFRSLKGLEHLVGISVAEPDKLDTGWKFDPGDWGPAANLHSAPRIPEAGEEIGRLYAYEASFADLFAALDWLKTRLDQSGETKSNQLD